MNFPIADLFVADSIRGRKFNQLAISFVLNQSVDVTVACVIPDALRFQLQRECVLRFFKMLESVTVFVASTPNIAANQTYPKMRVTLTRHAHRLFVRVWGIQTISTNRTTCMTAPFRQAGTMKSVVANTRNQTGLRSVETLQTNRASWELDQLCWIRREKYGLIVRRRIQKFNGADKKKMADFWLHRIEILEIVFGVKHIRARMILKSEQHHKFVGRRVSYNANVTHQFLISPHPVTKFSSGHSRRNRQNANDIRSKAGKRPSRQSCQFFSRRHSEQM